MKTPLKQGVNEQPPQNNRQGGPDLPVLLREGGIPLIQFTGGIEGNDDFLPRHMAVHINIVGLL